jgi:hypothetical protein
MQGRSDDVFWVASLRGPAAASPRILKKTIYGLGIHGHTRLLKRIELDPALPRPARAASAWWSSIADYIRSSAQS